MLYQIYDTSHFVVSPLTYMAETTRSLLQGSFVPPIVRDMSRTMMASAELFERMTRYYDKPEWMLDSTVRNGCVVQVKVEVSRHEPFCNLLHFAREGCASDPKVLIVAPLSGHHATLLRGTVEAMIREHDVYVTDWLDARDIPLTEGGFNLEDYISYLMAFIRALGPDVHVIAVCQPTVPVLCAVSLMAAMNDPCQPRSMILMGGPVDTSLAPTKVTKLADEHTLEWFEHTVVDVVPVYYKGAGRRVYPGFVQLSSFMSMNMGTHVGEHIRLFRNLVQGDESSAAAHRRFYDEYLAVMDITAEFYLQTVDRVFKKRALPNGTFRWKDMTVRPEAITRTALFTIEGERDDISAPGQTLAAQDLCRGLPTDKKKHVLIADVGHYGIFNGHHWREEVQPMIHRFIREHA